MHNIVIASTFEEAQVYSTRILDSDSVIIGLDTETTVDRTDDPGKVSLISIANTTDVYLFQIYRIWKQSNHTLTSGPRIPSALQKLLITEKIIKVGIGINHDAELLWESYGLHMRGWIDVQYVTRTLGIPQSSMADLCRLYLMGASEKDPYGHRGNWDEQLDPRQVAYASDDAIKSLNLYLAIMKLPNQNQTITTQQQSDDNSLLRWIQVELQRAVTPRSIDSLINQIVNSYGPWRNRFLESERRHMATTAIQQFIDSGAIPFDSQCRKFILPPRQKNT